jgi:hypothetical protein
MTRRIALIGLSALVLMALAAPTALARYVPGDDPRSVVPATNRIIDASDRVTLVAPQAGTVLVDAHQRSLGGNGGGVLTPTYSDAFERTAAAKPSTGATLIGDSHNRFDPGNLPVSTTTVSSGSEIEWPQIGIGFGLGIVLAFGLLLAARATRVRPLAH